MSHHFFWAERLFVNKHISIHVYSKDGKLLECVGIEEHDEDPFISDLLLYEKIRERQRMKAEPLVFLEDGWAAYIAFEDKIRNLYIGGPVCVASSKEERTGLFRYRKEHHLTQHYLNIPQMTILELANVLSMSVYAICGQEIEEMELLGINQITPMQKADTAKELTNYRFESSENEKKHIEYEYEQTYLDAIKKGDIEYFKAPVYNKLHLTDEIGKLAEGGLKQMEYMVAVGLTLASRAAIEGGVSPIQAYAVSDVFFQKLEKCRTQVEMFRLHTEIELAYVTMVHKQKMQKRNSYYVEQCKDYLTQNFHKRITVEELAKQIGVNRTYLSGKFSEQEGMSISRYSILVRLRAAENMLKYSEASISAISDYLCFSSQSHFGREFKKKNGISPAEYRKQNKNMHFIDKQTKITK